MATTSDRELMSAADVSRTIARIAHQIIEKTALEPGPPAGVDIAKDELSFFPLIYWPIDASAPMPSQAAIARMRSSFTAWTPGNASRSRSRDAARMPAPFAGADLAVIDCSFISLRKILPPAVALLRATGKIVALIKPQFEAGKTEADQGAGVITDPAIHERVLRELERFVAEQSFLRWCGVTESPLLGPAGNKEFLVLIEKQG